MNISVNLGRFVVSQEGDNIKEAITGLVESGAMEILSNNKCGVCGGEDVLPLMREVLDPEDKKGKATFKYFEMRCQSKGCWARLALGQKKTDNQLFPKKKDDNGNYLPNGGWEKYVKPQE